MKPQEFIDKWLGWAKNNEEINDEILNDLYAMNKALTIPAVVGRSEQYFCCKTQINQRCIEQCLGCFQFENKD